MMMQMLSRGEVRLLWHTRYWDYPREGALEWHGRRYWFAEVDEEPGVFDVMTLTDEQWATEQASNDDFRRFVGTHWDHAEPGNPFHRHHDDEGNIVGVRPRSEHHRFYDKWPPGRPGPRGPVVARWRYDDPPDPP